MTQVLDGQKVARQWRRSLRDGIRVETLGSRSPCLAIVRVGDDPDSANYVEMKLRAAAAVGIEGRELWLPRGSSADAVAEILDSANADPAIDGVMVQLPLPPHLATEAILSKIAPHKDVDGMTLATLGSVAAGGEFGPCTALGIMRLLRAYEIAIESRYAVVLGNDRFVAVPTALLLIHHGALVQVVESHRTDAADIARSADILVVALDRAESVDANWVKPGAVVVDTGSHRLGDGRIVGDVAYESVVERAGFVTPVPGGVGPLTIAALLHNTWSIARQRQEEG